VRIFIYCADPREEADLERKINEQLLSRNERDGSERVSLLSFYGGPMCLAYPKHRFLEDDAAWLLRQIRAGIKISPEISDVVLVGHNCGYYNYVLILADEAKKREDLKTAARYLRENIRTVKVATYYDNESSFEEVGITKVPAKAPALQLVLQE
jgi:hypothetical protein